MEENVARPLPRIRTAEGVLKIIKEMDPETEITLNFVRFIIKTDQVPVTKMGKKRLVDADVLVGRIASGQIKSAEELESTVGGIRQVPA